MDNELHILIVDASAGDAERMERELRRAEISFSSTRVHTRAAFLQQLDAVSPDLILADCVAPGLDGRTVLGLAQRRAPQAPVIICTSTTNVEVAVACINAGAADYVIKERLVRLAPAVRGALAQRRAAAQEEEVEHTLHAAAQRWQATFDAMRDAICLVDAEGRIVQCNAAMQDFLGKPCQDVVGQLCWQVLHEAAEPPSGCIWPRLHRSKQRETEVLEQHGRWLNVTVDPLLDEEGNLAGAVHIMADITQRKRAEAALRANEEKHRVMFESSQDAIMTLAPPSWRFTSGNPAAIAIFGAEDEADFVSRAPWEYSPLSQPDGRSSEDKSREMIETAMREGSHFFEWRHKRLGGEEFPATVLLTRFELAGRVLLQATVRDVSAERQLEEQLRQAAKMETIGQLAGGVAHDFNNILTGIKGYAEFLVRDTQDDPAKNQDAREVLRLCDSAAALTRQILAFSRKQTLRPQVLELNKLIENTARTLQRLIGENIRLQFTPAENLGRVQADPGQIEQVLLNLAVNARDAMPHGGELTIETANVELDEDYAATHVEATPGPYVMFAVTDTGRGMDQSTLDRVFEPFFTTKERGKGTGLGLATVYGIVKQHGGNIWVYSEPERGTTFKVYLPRIDRPASDSSPAERLAAAPGGSETILVVEDDASVRTVAQRTLEARGYTVLAAANAQEAEALVCGDGHAVSLLLTDVVMPGESGPQLYEQLRAAHPRLRVAYMSGYATDAIGRHGILAPDAAFISKPFTPESLARDVRQVLDS